MTASDHARAAAGWCPTGWRREGPDEPGWWVYLDHAGNRGFNWYDDDVRPGDSPKWWMRLPDLPPA